MFKDIKTHILHYLILLLILAFGFGAFYSFSYNRFFQFQIGIATVIGYLIWGIVHHLLEKNLNLKIVVEYILVAALVLTILFTLLVSL